MGVRGLEYGTFDVFTNNVFRGNPLAIVHVPHDRTLSQDEKQSIAREFNYSETVFLHLPAPGTAIGRWNIDIFTLDQELPFAGHPTIGTAWALGQMYPELEQGILQTKAGPIPITFERNKPNYCEAIANIPHKVHLHSKRLAIDKFSNLQLALAAECQLPASGFNVFSIVKGMTFALIELKSTKELDKVTLSSTPTSYCVELDAGWSPSFVGAYFYVVHGGLSAADHFTISCRMIEAGVGEDPATGSAASALTAFLATERLKQHPQASKDVSFELRQGVQMGRDSLIGIKVACDVSGEIDKIFLSGSAVQVMSGRLL